MTPLVLVAGLSCKGCEGGTRGFRPALVGGWSWVVPELRLRW